MQRRCFSLVFMILLSFFLAASPCLAASIWKEGQWQKDGAIDIFNEVTIRKDGTIEVMARYKGVVGNFIHPLSRTYASNARFIEAAPIEFVSASVDGRPAQAAISVNAGEPSAVRINAPGPGSHTYVIRLKTTDRVLFGNKKYDEFTWDFGRFNGGKARVSCAIILPEGAELLEQKVRLGHETVGHKKTLAFKGKTGAALYRGDEYMTEAGEAFVVTARWSKGAVIPTKNAESMAGMERNSWIVLAIVLLMSFAAWWFFGRDPHPRTIVPRFYPPVLSDGTIFSPAAVAYVRDSARLSSRGFAGMLLNLAVQKALSFSGTGSRKDPYVLSKRTGPLPSGKADAEDRVAPGRPAEADLNSRWNRLIRRGTGFDEAEKSALARLFAFAGSISIRGRQSPWSLAQARGDAYMALAQNLRGTWKLRADIVAAMHFLAYLLVIAFVTVQGLMHGSGIAAVCALVSLCALMAWLYSRTVDRVHRFFIQWQEMGWPAMTAFILFCLLIPFSILYDGLIDETMTDFPGYGFMHSWNWLRLILFPVLWIFLYRRTGNLAAVTIGPLKFLGFFLCFFLLAGTCWAMNFPGTSGIALILAMFTPTLFMPVMKQPSEKALQLMADIEGFAMYIKAAETQRLNLENPPERTPQEFERVMPYAVALGLENAWGAKFAQLASQMHFNGSVGTLDQFQHRMSGM